MRCALSQGGSTARQHNHVAMGRHGMLSNVQYEYGAQSARYAGRFLFIVSHMRSFSSLLCHILGSHPEISGYAEAQLSYFSRLDLQRLARKVQQITGNPVLGRYVLDKILHNHREIAPGVLDRPEIKGDVPAAQRRGHVPQPREPEPDPAAQRQRFGDPMRASTTTSARLRQLEGYCALLGGNALFLASERLLSDTERVLVELSRWLELGETAEGGLPDVSLQRRARLRRSFTDDTRRDGRPRRGRPDTSTTCRYRFPTSCFRQGIEAHETCREPYRCCRR